jgi:hypothetical protein
MPKPRKRTIPILPLSAGTLLLAAGYLAYRGNMPGESPATKTLAPVASTPSPAPIIRTKSSHEREATGRRGGNAPSLSASEEVASLVGNAALSDSEVIGGLRLIVEDSKRPLPERTEALEHIIHLVPSENPEPLLSIAADGRQPREISELILAEALNRPARLQGELLIRLLGHSSGSMLQEVLEELKALVGEDHGSKPAGWRMAISQLPES